MNNPDDHGKRSLYFPGAMLDEMRSEAKRLDRSLSWVVQRAWKVARKAILKLPDSTIRREDEHA